MSEQSDERTVLTPNEEKLFEWTNPVPTASLNWLAGEPVEAKPILYTLRITGGSTSNL